MLCNLGWTSRVSKFEHWSLNLYLFWYGGSVEAEKQTMIGWTEINKLIEAMTTMASNKEESFFDWKLHCIVALIAFIFIF